MPKAKKKIKEEPISVWLDFENNLGQSSYTLPEHLQTMQTHHQNNNENNSVSTSGTAKQKSKISQKALKNQEVNS